MKAIFASDLAGGFGSEGRLPWGKIAIDMNFFMQTTSNHIVVMGRSTWKKLPNLPYRTVIVVTSSPIEGVYTLHPDTYMEELKELEKVAKKEIFLIGGTKLLSVEALKQCEEIFHTLVKSTNAHDVRIPDTVLEYLATLNPSTIKENNQCTIRSLKCFPKQEA